MSKVLIANWKANPTTLDEALELFDFYLAEISKYQNIQLVVCPPFVYLEELAQKLPITNYTRPTADAVSGLGQLPITIGAQDLFWKKSGPYTGEISVDMLHPVKSPVNFSLKEFHGGALREQFDGVKKFGVTHVLVGHSDRRYKIGETDEVINKKIKAVLAADIIPVLLVGERNRGDDRKQILEQQLTADFDGLTAEQVSKILITYEPIWAISTMPGAEPDDPENTLSALEIIREFIMRNFQFPISNLQLLYGGSLNSENIADFLKHPEISGAVIGGASLKKEEFGKILEMASNL